MSATEYPKQIKGFVVSTQEAEQCVHDFYEWIDEQLQEYENPVEFQVADHLELAANIKPALFQQELLELYNMEDNWRELCQFGYDYCRPEIRAWVNQISHGLSLLGMVDMFMMNEYGGRQAYERVCLGYQVYPRVLRFIRCYTEPMFPHGKAPLSALKSLLGEAIRLICDNGVVEIIPFVAVLRPELVRDECHPMISKNKYGEINWNLLATLPFYTPELLIRCQPFMT